MSVAAMVASDVLVGPFSTNEKLSAFCFLLSANCRYTHTLKMKSDHKLLDPLP
jgi:hypothetical protein